jgi:hypothetical protein
VRTLLAQIYEGGQFHDAAITQKRALYNALAERGPVLDWDYLDNDAATRFQGLVNRIEQFNPDLIFTQLHGADIFTPAQIRDLKERYHGITWVNMSGDSWLHSLTSEPMLALAREFDLWLVCAPDVLPIYAEHGINAAFWQIALDPPVIPLPDMPTYDVVFMGNVISDKRRALLEKLRTLDGVNVGIYGDWQQADGHNTYHFAEGEALYKNATLAIADCAYPDQDNYVSNRPIQILAAGGAMLLHQHVPKMDILLGIEAGVHFIEWQSLDDLPSVIDYWLHGEQLRRRREIVNAGRELALAKHTYTERVRELFEDLLPMITGVKA